MDNYSALDMTSAKGKSGLLFFLLILIVAVLVELPIGNMIRQYVVLRNDLEHLNKFRDPDAYASFLFKTHPADKTAPASILDIFFTSMPSLKKRLQNIRRWKSDHFLFLPHFSIRDFRCYIFRPLRLPGFTGNDLQQYAFFSFTLWPELLHENS